MVNSRTSLKNRVFGIPEELDELLKLYSSRKNISVSEFIRNALKTSIDKHKNEEEQFWRELPEEKLDDILESLIKHLDLKFSGIERHFCEHSSLWENVYDENFDHTKEFCNELQIEFSSFIKRVETDFYTNFDCECQLYEVLKNRRGSDDNNETIKS